MNARLILLMIPLMAFFIGCFGQEDSQIFSSGEGSHRVQLHDVSHIDFPGTVGRLAISNDVVQLMIATSYDTKADQPQCRFLEPSKSAKYAPWAPVTAFWRIHSNKNKSSFTSSLKNLYPGFDLELDHFYPKPKFFNAMEEKHKSYVSIKKQHEVSALKNIKTTDNQIIFQLQTDPNTVIINLLIETNYDSKNGCQTNIEYWCSMSGDFCKDSSQTNKKDLEDYYTSNKNQGSRGFGIYINFTGRSYSVVKSEMPSRIQTKQTEYKKADKFGLHKVEYFTNLEEQNTQENSTELQDTNIEITPETAEEILKEKGTQIVDLLRKAIPFSKVELTIDRNFIRYFEQAIPDIFGFKTDALREICEDLIQRTGFESFTMKATSDNEEQNRLDMYFRFDKENTLAQRSVNSETDLNHIHFGREVHVSGILTKEDFRTVAFEGVKYTTHKNQEFTVDKLLLLHNEEGNLIKMKEDNYIVPLDIKEIANFYHHNADKIEKFQQGIDIDDITKHEALKTLINIIMTTKNLPASNHIVLQKKFGSDEFDLILGIINNALVFSADVTGGYDLVNQLTELEITPGKIKLGFHNAIVSTQLTQDFIKTGRNALGKSITSSSADRTLKFYSPETRYYSTISVNPNFNQNSLRLDGYRPEQNQLLFDGIYLVHNYGSTNNNYSTMYGMSYRSSSNSGEEYGILNLPFNSSVISQDINLINKDVMGVVFNIKE